MSSKIEAIVDLILVDMALMHMDGSLIPQVKAQLLSTRSTSIAVHNRCKFHLLLQPYCGDRHLCVKSDGNNQVTKLPRGPLIMQFQCFCGIACCLGDFWMSGQEQQQKALQIFEGTGVTAVVAGSQTSLMGSVPSVVPSPWRNIDGTCAYVYFFHPNP